MLSDKKAAELVHNIGDILSNPNSLNQDIISSVRGMIGILISLDKEIQKKVIHKMVDIVFESDSKESLIGFVAGSIYDVYRDRQAEQSPLFQWKPELLKFVSDPQKRLIQIIDECSSEIQK